MTAYTYAIHPLSVGIYKMTSIMQHIVI